MINNRKIIGIALSSIFEKTSYDLVSSINKRLVEHGYRLMVFHCNSHFYGYLPEEIGETRIYEMMPFDILDGLIVCEETFSVRSIAGWIIELAKSHEIPTYVIGGTNKGTINFEFNYNSGFELIVRHVIEEHHVKNPVFMGGMPNNEYSDSRLDIFKKVCIENNISFDEEKQVYYGKFYDSPAKRATKKIIESGNIPDAIICANDSMAIAVCSVLIENGIRVPEDVIVSGFDGVEEIYYSNPQISTVSCSSIDMAEAVADSIINDSGNEFRRIHPKLHILESCGCGYRKMVNGAEMQSKLHNRLFQYIEKEQRLINMGNRMQNCNSIDEMVGCMNYPWMENVTFVCTPEATDATIDNLGTMANDIPESYICVYDNNERKTTNSNTIIDKKDIIPNFEQLIEREAPMIFNAVFINNTILGYFCIHGEQESFETGFLLPQLSISLRLGMSGFQRNKHQELLSGRMLELYKTDDLTGLLLRRAISVEFGLLTKNIQSGNHKLAILLADLDGLKIINDMYGHEEGDKAIIAVAKALKDSVPQDSAVFRYGGDEMLALFSTDGDVSEIRTKIDNYLAQYNEMVNPPYKVSASIGIVIEDRPAGKKMKDLIAAADELMYNEKRAKKAERTDT